MSTEAKTVIADPYVIRQRYSDAHESLSRLVREYEILRAALWTALARTEIVVECDAVGNLTGDESKHIEIAPTGNGGIIVRRARVTKVPK